MKLTVIKWTNVQGKLEDINTLEAKILDAHIENRTFGKRWSAEVAIGLRGAEKEMVESCLAELEAEEQASKGAT